MINTAVVVVVSMCRSAYNVYTNTMRVCCSNKHFFFFFKRDKKTFLSFLSLPYGKAAEGSLSENSSSRFNLVRSAHKSVRNSTTRRRYTCTRCGTPTCGATYWTSCAFRKSWDVYHSYNTTILRPRYSLDIIFILYYICVLFYWKPVLTWTSTSSSS